MLHVGVNLGFGNLHADLSDEQMYAGEIRIAELAQALRAAGLDTASAAYAASALWGTPAQILAQIAAIATVLGDFELIVLPSFGGMPYQQAERSLELFAKEVMPAAREPGAAAWPS